MMAYITVAQVKEIRRELATLKPVKVTLDGNRSMTVKEAIFALAPALERMKKRGFDTQEIAEKLHERGIEIKPPTLAKDLNEFRRGRERKKGTPRPLEKTAPTPAPTPKPDRPTTVSAGCFAIRPDIPLEDL
jgi:hypothetical protein